jgi:hypothetical protein
VCVGSGDLQRSGAHIAQRELVVGGVVDDVVGVLVIFSAHGVLGAAFRRSVLSWNCGTAGWEWPPSHAGLAASDVPHAGGAGGIARLDSVKLLTGLAGLALLGLGLILAVASLVVTEQALQANLIPVGFVLIGLGLIVLTYWVVPTRRNE